MSIANGLSSLALLLLGFGAYSAALSAEIPKEQLLEQVARSVEASRQLSVKVVADGKRSVGDGDAEPTGERHLLDFIRCGDTERISFTQLVDGQAGVFRHEYLIEGDSQVLSMTARLEEDLSQAALDEYGENLKVMLSDKALVAGGNPVLDRPAVYRLIGDFALNNWIVGFSAITDYLNQENLSISSTSRGVNVASDGKFGAFEAELSEEHGFLPIFFRVFKSQEIEVAGKKLRNLYASDPIEEDPSIVYPDGYEASSANAFLIRSAQWEGEVHEFRRDGAGNWYPATASVSTTFHYVDGTKVVSTNKLIVEIVESHPGCGPTLDIPDNYAVGVDGAQHLPFRWNGEKAAPGLPDLPLSKRPPGDLYRIGGATKFWLILANAALLGIGLAVYWFSKRDRNNAGSATK